MLMGGHELLESSPVTGSKPLEEGGSITARSFTHGKTIPRLESSGLEMWRRVDPAWRRPAAGPVVDSRRHDEA